MRFARRGGCRAVCWDSRRLRSRHVVLIFGSERDGSRSSGSIEHVRVKAKVAMRIEWRTFAIQVSLNH
jgi:hypothetical protein